MLGIKIEGKSATGEERWIGPAPWIETALPGPHARILLRGDDDTRSAPCLGPQNLVVRRALGSVVEDVDGNRFLDFAAEAGAGTAGHGHPRVVAAVESQAQQFIPAGGEQLVSTAALELLERLSSIASQDKVMRVHLTNSASEACEASIRLVRADSHRPWLIAFHGGFHGQTAGGQSLSCVSASERGRASPTPPMVLHAPYNDVEFLENRLFRYEVNANEVAAIYVEPMQVSSGGALPDPTFFHELRALCDRHGILLVIDETRTGAGRTGRWFAHQHFQVVPDVILMGEGVSSGMPLGAVCAGVHVMGRDAVSRLGLSGGSPVSCAAGLATLRLVEESYMANAARLGTRMIQSIRNIAESRKVLIAPRGLGLIAVADVVSRRTGKGDAKRRDRIVQACFERGLLIGRTGPHGLRFSPPMCMNDAQLEVGFKLFDEAVATVL